MAASKCNIIVQHGTGHIIKEDISAMMSMELLTRHEPQRLLREGIISIPFRTRRQTVPRVQSKNGDSNLTDFSAEAASMTTIHYLART